MEITGTWAAHLQPVNGNLEWSVVPRRARIAMVSGRVFAAIRRDANGWMVSIPGYTWPATEAARRFGATRSAVKIFKTASEAQRAVVLAYQLRNDKSTK